MNLAGDGAASHFTAEITLVEPRPFCHFVSPDKRIARNRT
jgi:hypothetical protein